MEAPAQPAPANVLVGAGQWPRFGEPKRQGHSECSLYSHLTVPALGEADEAYRVILKVDAVDPDIERQLAGHCVRAVNAVPTVRGAMEEAFRKLDSVAFLSEEGDTDEVKRLLRSALAELAGTVRPVCGACDGDGVLMATVSKTDGRAQARQCPVCRPDNGRPPHPAIHSPEMERAAAEYARAGQS